MGMNLKFLGFTPNYKIAGPVKIAFIGIKIFRHHNFIDLGKPGKGKSNFRGVFNGPAQLEMRVPGIINPTTRWRQG